MMTNIGMSHWKWRLRWYIAEKLIGWGVFRVMPKCEAQEDFVDAVRDWADKWVCRDRRERMRDEPADDLKKRIAELEAEIASLRKERDEALQVAEIVRQLATTPISDADVARAVKEAKRVLGQRCQHCGLSGTTTDQRAQNKAIARRGSEPPHDTAKV